MKRNERTQKISRMIQKELAQAFPVLEPRLPHLTTLSMVEVSPDLSFAKVYITMFGDDEELKATLALLKSHARYLRAQLAARLNLRRTPQLAFVHDEGLVRGQHVSQLINKVVA